MKIKVDIQNASKLLRGLAKVNKVKEHNIVTELLGLPSVAEGKLAQLGIEPSKRVGAVFLAASEASEASSGGKRIGTAVRLEKGKSGWFLTYIERVNLGRAGGWRKLLLTEEQSRKAIANFKNSYENF